MWSSLGPDQARHYVGPDLHPNCLQRLSADDKLATNRERVHVTSNMFLVVSQQCLDVAGSLILIFKRLFKRLPQWSIMVLRCGILIYSARQGLTSPLGTHSCTPLVSSEGPIGLDKSGYQVHVNIFLISPWKHITYVVGTHLKRLGAPGQGASNEYLQHMFLWRNKKNINTFGVEKASYQ